MIEHLQLHHFDKNDNAWKRQCFTEESANITGIRIANQLNDIINMIHSLNMTVEIKNYYAKRAGNSDKY